MDGGAPDAGPAFCDPSLPTLALCLRCEDPARDEFGYAQTVDTDATTTRGAVGAAGRLEAGTRARVSDAPHLDGAEITVELFARVDALPSAGRAGLVDKNQAFGLFVYPGG
ncbi:MAG TPA: hypothetical protein RMH99_01525 [Sandaracinaceae bacterium LLY-WYZ-13_1]|nr:hypothetical protein [Sandaracinaceae bacterium LLY-WYZ-13_1]